MRTVLPLLLVALAAPALAQSPANEQIPYQGYLTDDGAPVSDPALPLTFCLGTGGSADWCEDATVAVVDGTFSHAIGSVDAITGVDFGRPVELFITVDDATALPPVPLGAAPASRAVALGDRGLRVPASGVDGVEVAGAAGNGLAVRSADLDGLYVTAAGGAGVRVGTAPVGLHVEAASTAALLVGPLSSPTFSVTDTGSMVVTGPASINGPIYGGDVLVRTVYATGYVEATDIGADGTVSATHVTASGDVTAATVDATTVSAGRVSATQGGSLSPGTFTATGTAPTLSLRRSSASGTLLVGHNAETPGSNTSVFAVRANGDVEADGDLEIGGAATVGGALSAGGDVTNGRGVSLPVGIASVDLRENSSGTYSAVVSGSAGVTATANNNAGWTVVRVSGLSLTPTNSVVQVTRMSSGADDLTSVRVGYTGDGGVIVITEEEGVVAPGYVFEDFSIVIYAL